MNPSTGCSPEARARAVRMVFEYRSEHDPQRATIRPAPATTGHAAATFPERLP